MATSPQPDPSASIADPALPQPRDAGNWAGLVTKLQVDPEHAKAGFNVAGRRLTGPQQGFGRLWQRTYSAEIGPKVTPQGLISEWKMHFGEFWGKGNVFHGALTGIAPGEVAPIAINTGGGVKLSTGVLVLYADDESFTFMTPQGHMFAGWITFSAWDNAGSTMAQIQILVRPNDPIYEAGWFVMRRMEDKFWKQTMRNLAAHVGVRDVRVDEKTVLVDKRRLWGNWKNIWHNAGIRSVLHLVTAPVRLFRRGGATTE